MESYQLKFIEEAKELIVQLEDALLGLEQNPSSAELVNEIFRIMHSLKGSGAMFGFTKLSAITHDLENVYAAIRSGNLVVSKNLLDISLQSIDIIRALLEDSNKTETDDQLNQLGHDLRLILSYKSKDSFPSQANQSKTSSPEAEQKDQRESVHLIEFIPDESLMVAGNNPLYLLDELDTLGQLTAVPNVSKLPDFEQLEPSKCYISWRMVLISKAKPDTIKEVFLFVENLCQLNISKLNISNPPLSKLRQQELKTLLASSEALPAVITAWFSSLDSLAEVPAAKPILTVIQQPDIESKEVKSGKEEISIRVSSQRIDELMNLVSELIVSQGQLSVAAGRIREDSLLILNEKFEKLIRQLREQTMEMSLIAFNTLSTRFKRLVRELSHELDKKVELLIEGGETELDKTIIEHLSEPILHILRNCMDHGIEAPNERLKKGKTEVGKISIEAFYSGAEVHILIEDDGQGIDPVKVLESAREKGLVQGHERISDQEILNLLFKPGFSTAKETTAYSGRGVGMDVVETKINTLRGEVSLNSSIGVGTSVLIKLPLTLTILDGLLTQVAQTNYIIPVSSIRKIYPVDIKTLESAFNNLIILEGEQIPVLLLRKEFNEALPKSGLQQLVLVEYEKNKIGLVVDEVIGERQAVLKPLGQSFHNNKIFSGGSIMGDGNIALVLDTNKLVRQFTVNENSSGVYT